MEEEVCKHHPRGYCKFRGECQKYHENEICKEKSCSSKECRKGQPKISKYFGERGFCRYGKVCAYAHSEEVNKKEVKIINEAIKNMRAEIDTLKITVSSLSYINKEAKVNMNMIKTLKEDIKKIQNENSTIFNKIRLLEEELQESDSEESLGCDYKQLSENGDRKTSYIECYICDFKCERETTLGKQNTTKKRSKEDSKT